METHPTSGMSDAQTVSRISVLEAELTRRKQELRELRIANAEHKVGDVAKLRTGEERVVTQLVYEWGTVHYLGAARKKNGEWGSRSSRLWNIAEWIA